MEPLPRQSESLLNCPVFDTKCKLDFLGRTHDLNNCSPSSELISLSIFHLPSLVTDFGDGDFLFDYSKNLVTEETMKLLLELARERKVEEGRDKMFRWTKEMSIEFDPSSPI